MKIVAISDTHNLHREITIPPCDLLIHAGDATMLGTEKEMEDFAEWFSEQPAKTKVFIPGNHEVEFYHKLNMRHDGYCDYKNMFSSYDLGTDLLIDSPLYLDKDYEILLYGSPWTTVSPKWGFQFPWYERNHETQRKTWAAIPEDVNILVTHGPPYGILDGVPKYLGMFGEDMSKYNLVTEACGDEILKQEIQKRKKLKYHFFGHIHEGYGHKELNGVHYYNVSICDRNYKAVNPVTVVEI